MLKTVKNAEFMRELKKTDMDIRAKAYLGTICSYQDPYYDNGRYVFSLRQNLFHIVTLTPVSFTLYSGDGEVIENLTEQELILKAENKLKNINDTISSLRELGWI